MQPSRRAPRHRPPRGAPPPPPGGRLSTSSPTDLRPPAPGQTSSLPGPRAAQAGRRLPRQASPVSGCRRPRPAPRASSLPLSNPKPRAPTGPCASAPTKPAARRTRRGAGSGSGGARAWRRHPRAGRVQRAGAVGTWRAEKGEESILLGANAFYARFRSSSLALLPLPERVRLSRWDLAGAEGEAEGTQWPGGRAAPLPLSRVSGWTTVNVAMSAVGAEVTLGFSISNRL